MGALSGLRVVELAEGIAGPYCGKLLADLGAEVIKVEPPAGDRARRLGPFPKDEPDPNRSALFIYLNTSKRGLVLDLTTDDGSAELDDLLRDADLLIDDRGPNPPAGGLPSLQTLFQRHPRLCAVSVTPFGLSGPAAGHPVSDLTIFMASGFGQVTPQGIQNPEQEEPLRMPGQQTQFVAGLTAATAALHALFAREATGQGQLADVSAQEAMASFAFMLVGATAFLKREMPRQAPISSGTPWLNSRFRCADGYVHAVMMEDRQWHSWVEVLGSPAWASEPRFADGYQRNENWADLLPLIEAWTTRHPKAEVARLAQARRVPVLPINTVADLSESEQLAARDFFVEIDQPGLGPIRLPGHPYRMTAAPWESRPAPVRGEGPARQSGAGESAAGATWTTAPSVGSRSGTPSRNGASLPLSGIRVADFSWVFAGPICTRNLAALGAEVIRVESHKRVDTHRLSGLRDAAGKPRVNASPYFYLVNYNKQSVTLDISQPRGLEIAKEIVRHSDIVIENFAHGVMDRLGLGYDVLREIKPDIISIASSGLGRTGPQKEYVAYGMTLHAYSGLTSLTGYPGGPPRGTGTTWSDPLTGLWATYAALAAIRHRQRTGEGQQIDLSMAEATAAMLAEPLLDYGLNGRVWESVGNIDRLAVPHGTYRCQGDDRWVAVAVTSDEEWAGLCRVLSRPELAADPRYATLAGRQARHDELDALVTAWTKTRTAEEAERQLLAAGVPAQVVLDGPGLLANEQLRARNFFVELDHVDGGICPVLRLPWVLEPGPNPVLTPAPALGADNERVYRTFLGLSDGEMAQLVDSGVIT